MARLQDRLLIVSGGAHGIGHAYGEGLARALKRTKVPQDLVGTVVFLCASESDFMTGQTLVVDGGAQMHYRSRRATYQRQR
jgi:NAD(P)-dependent dehydrogenase (short-subunit alcohol dehydrogenase family)